MKLETSVAALVAIVFASGTATAKTFIDYIQPTPIVCSPLSSATWGVAGVLPRDTCNGIEDAKGAGVPPGWFYWDGQIIKAKDGKYHMFMSTWEPGTVGFQRWSSSDAYHAMSDKDVLGPYLRQDYVYTNNGSHKGHNVSALELLDGTYAVVVSEIVQFTIYKSSSLDGPWTACPGGELIQTNGIKTNSTVTCHDGGPCNDSHWDSNVSLVARADGKFEIVQRHGFIAIADTLCGPYKMQKPTWTYPQANLPNVDSIYPNRTSIPGVSNPTYGWEEDPHIWYSAGVYHVIYSGSGDRVGWHLYSTDGIHDWKDDGLAYTPRQYQKIFCYEGGTTCTAWYKTERPGVVLENGHPTHITLAVADVDKDNQIPAGSNHGSKVVVVPFDGVAFDNDYGVSGTGGAGSGGASSTGGTSSAGGTKAMGGSSTAGGTRAIGGSNATGGAVAMGGSVNSAGGTKATGGLAATGGAKATGGLSSGWNSGGATIITAAGGNISTGGAMNLSGGAPAATGGSSAHSGGDGPGGQLGTGGSFAVGGMQSSGGITGSIAPSTTVVAATNINDSSNASGCSCRLADGRSHSKPWAILGVTALSIFRSRKRQLKR